MVQQRSYRATIVSTLGLDLLLTGSMLALFTFNLTGAYIHEWLGLVLCLLFPTHMLVNWAWLAATTRQLFRPLHWRMRLRYLLNASLFVAIIVVTLSGLVISEALFPGLAGVAGNPGFWHPIHTQASNVTLALIGLHLGVYWRNVLTMLRRLFTSERRDAALRPRVGVVSSRTGA